MTERRRPPLDAQPADPLLRSLSFRVARLEEHVGELVGSLSTAWQRIERLERQGVSLAPTPAPAPTPQRILAPRVGAGEAAKLIGCDVRTVRRLIESGRLRGVAVPLAGDRRRRWMAERADVERLLGARRGPTAASAASKPEIASASRVSRSKG